MANIRWFIRWNNPCSRSKAITAEVSTIEGKIILWRLQSIERLPGCLHCPRNCTSHLWWMFNHHKVSFGRLFASPLLVRRYTGNGWKFTSTLPQHTVPKHDLSATLRQLIQSRTAAPFCSFSSIICNCQSHLIRNITQTSSRFSKRDW